MLSTHKNLVVRKTSGGCQKDLVSVKRVMVVVWFLQRPLVSVKRGRVKVWLLQRPPLTVTVNNVWHMLGCSEGTSKINLYDVWHMPGCAEGTLHAADSGSRF